ncbi:VOC family protein [Vibrio sp. M60_M31a]
MFNAIHHVAIICSDYPTSKHFYTEILGLSVIARKITVQRVILISSTLRFLMAARLNYSVFQMYLSACFPEAQGLRHLAFQVDDIEEVKTYLESKNIAVEPIRIDEFTGKAFTFFQDPDRLPLELYQK